MSSEFIQSFLLIFFAEMGDKSQILAMAFATKYSIRKVLAGIFIGALLNHGLAVALGNYISSFIPISVIQIFAGFIFIAFALWTLKPENEDSDEEEKELKVGPVLTVAIAFFIGELGDKTQLTAITLGSNAVYPLVVLAGTVSGMVFTGGIGILIGKKLGDKVPELAMKIIASTLFLYFGFSKLAQSIPVGYLSSQIIILFTVGVLFIFIFLMRVNVINSRKGFVSKYKATSKELYEYYKKIESSMSNICLGTEKCKNCQGEGCIIGYTKKIVKDSLNNVPYLLEREFVPGEGVLLKEFDTEETIKSYITTLDIIFNKPSEANSSVHLIRKQLELILFKESITEFKDYGDYKRIVSGKNPMIATRIFNELS